jgi:hypothetical protein
MRTELEASVPRLATFADLSIRIEMASQVSRSRHGALGMPFLWKWGICTIGGETHHPMVTEDR